MKANLFSYGDKVYQRLTNEQAREAITFAEPNWYDRPYQLNIVLALMDYQEDGVVAESRDLEYYISENQTYLEEYGSNCVDIVLFKGFNSREVCEEYLDLDNNESVMYNEHLKTWSIHYN